MDKSLHLNLQMVSDEGERLTMVDKFNDENFNLYKFKLKMVLAIKDLWKIVDCLEVPPPSTTNDNDKKTYERRCKMTFTIIATHLVEARSWCTSKGAKDKQKREGHYAT